jgi:hypothetical protein
MSLSPEVAAPGEEITAAAVEPCSVDGEGVAYIAWAIGRVGEDVDPNAETEGPLWEVTFEAPQEEGDYVFVAFCEVAEIPDARNFVYSAEFTVKGDDTEPPDDPDPGAPTPADPAPPVQGEPGFTG